MPRLTATALPCLLLLVACSPPQPPDKERPPEPQADRDATQLRDAIQAPIDKAKATEQVLQEAAEAREAAIEADGG